MTDLPESAQILWSRLAVFANSCSTEAIAAVHGVGLTADERQALLTRLIDQHRLQSSGEGPETRYRIPDDQRVEAYRQLVQSGDEERMYERAIAFYVRLAEQALEESFGPQRALWMSKLEQEHDNLAAVLDWCVKQGHAERGLELAIVLMELWFEDAHTGEGRDWFAKLLALPLAAAHTARRATALDLAGALALNQEDYALARQYKEEGLAILRELGEPIPIGFALLHLSHLTGFAQGDYVAARALYQESLGLLRGANHAEGTAHALANLGTIETLLGDFASAQQHLAECLQIYQRLNDGYDIALTLRRAAGVAVGLGQPQHALRLAAAGKAHIAAIGVSLPAFLDAPLEDMLHPVHSTLSENAQALLSKEGQALSLDEAVAQTLEMLL